METGGLPTCFRPCSVSRTSPLLPTSPQLEVAYGLATRACLVGLQSCREEGRLEGRTETTQVSRGQAPGRRGRQHWAPGGSGPALGTRLAPPAAPPRGGLTHRCRNAPSIFSTPRAQSGLLREALAGRSRGGRVAKVAHTLQNETQMEKERQNGFQRSSLRSSESWSARSSRIRRSSERKNAKSEPWRGVDR